MKIVVDDHTLTAWAQEYHNKTRRGIPYFWIMTFEQYVEMKKDRSKTA